MAESDCNLAIALDGNYCKAFARRGAARFALQKYESALEGDASVTTKRSRCLSSAEVNRCASAFGLDYEMVLKLDPGNFEAQSEVKKIRQVNLKRVILRVQSVSQGRCCCFLCLFFELFFFPAWFQSVGDQDSPGSSQSTQPQQAPVSDSLQQLIEEQQRRQEAVVQKDRVSLVCTVYQRQSNLE